MDFEFDVFLSYKNCDQDWTRRLRLRLVDAGLRVWLDQNEIQPGDLFIEALEAGLEKSRTVVLVCSPEAMRSRWVVNEYNRALTLMNFADSPRRIIPVLLRDCELPGFLATRQWVDFRDEAQFEQRLSQLIWGITGEWPDAPHAPDQAELHEIMLTAKSSLVIWGHTLDKFAQDIRVKQALGVLFDRGVHVRVVLLNPHCSYAHAHEPFHVLESRGSAQQQILNAIEFMKRAAMLYANPTTFDVYLTNYMPRFRTILVDDDVCYVSLYLFGEDVGAAPEFKVKRGDHGPAAIWFESVSTSLHKMLGSASVIPLITAGRFNDNWAASRIATFVTNCLSNRCCRGAENCWSQVRSIALGFQNDDPSLAEAHGLIDSDYEAGTFRINEVSANTPFLTTRIEFDQWAGDVLADDMKAIAEAHPLLARSPAWWGAAGRVLEALNFDPPGTQEPLKNEVWFQEYSDVFRRLLLTFVANDPDCALDLYPNLTTNRRDFLFELLEYLERQYHPDLAQWLHLSVAAGLLGIDEKPAHAATSGIDAIKGISLERPGEAPATRLRRVADDLWDAATSTCRIDATNAFLLRVESRRRGIKLVAFPDDYLETIVLLRFYEKLLARSPQLRIHLVPRSIRCSNDATFDDVMSFLPRFPGLHNDRFVVERNGPKIGGVNIQKLHPKILGLLRECHAVDVRGARNYEMLQGLRKEAYFGFMVCREFSEATIGLFAPDRPFVYIRHLPGDRSFEGFRDRHLRQVDGAWLAARTVADDKARWEGGHLAPFGTWSRGRKEAYRVLQAYYGDEAGDFDARFGKTLEPEVTALLDRFEGRVLVVGCGSGKEVEHLCRRGCDAYGIDAAPEAVALAEQRHPQLKGRFSVMDLYDLDLRRPRVVYDGLVANAVLVHLLDRADLGAVLRSFTALLRDGGRCFVRVLEKQGRQQELDIRNEKRPRWFVYFDQAELCAAADEAGFDLEFGPDRRAHARGYPGVAWISALLRRRDRAPVER